MENALTGEYDTEMTSSARTKRQSRYVNDSCSLKITQPVAIHDVLETRSALEKQICHQEAVRKEGGACFDRVRPRLGISSLVIPSGTALEATAALWHNSGVFGECPVLREPHFKGDIDS